MCGKQAPPSKAAGARHGSRAVQTSMHGQSHPHPQHPLTQSAQLRVKRWLLCTFGRGLPFIAAAVGTAGRGGPVAAAAATTAVAASAAAAAPAAAAAAIDPVPGGAHCT